MLASIWLPRKLHRVFAEDLVCQGEDLVLGCNYHSRLIDSTGIGIIVMHKHRVHNRLLLLDQVIVGTGSEASVGRRCWL